MFKREKIIFEKTTHYEKYQVIDMIYEGRKARVLFCGNKAAAFSGIPLDGKHSLLFDYIQRMYEVVAAIYPQNILLIGGGTYTLPTAILSSLPDIQIDTVEIDSEMDKIARQFFNFSEHPNHKIHHTDGKNYLRSHETKYTMIILDAFTKLDVPSVFFEESTVKNIHTHLKSNGCVVINVLSSFYGKRSDVLKHYVRLYSKFFKNIVVYQADSSLSLWSEQNFIFIAEKSNLRSTHGFTYSPLELNAIK